MIPLREYQSGAEMRAAYARVGSRLMGQCRARFGYMHPLLTWRTPVVVDLGPRGRRPSRAKYVNTENNIATALHLIQAGQISCRNIQEVVASVYGISRKEIINHSRLKEHAEARAVAMAFSWILLTFASYPRLGKWFERDHTCVVRAVRRYGPAIEGMLNGRQDISYRSPTKGYARCCPPAINDRMDGREVRSLGDSERHPCARDSCAREARP